MEMKNCPNDQEVSQSILVNIPAVTKNHRDCDVGKTLKCSLKNSNSSRNYAVYYIKYTTFVWNEKLPITV